MKKGQYLFLVYLFLVAFQINSLSNKDSNINQTQIWDSTPPSQLQNTNLKKLTTDGTKIIAKDTGKEILLKGFAFTGGVWQKPFADIKEVEYMTDEWDFQMIKSWGVNVITFYMDYHWFNSKDGILFMDKVLNWCRRYNVYIVPNLDVMPEGGNRGGKDFFENENAKRKIVDFWKNFTTRYNDREEIAGYSILDEPHATGSLVLTGDNFKSMLKIYYEKLIDVIRKIDPVTPIQIQTIYGNPNDFVEVNKNKTHIVYNIHFYEPMYFTSQGEPWIANGGVPENVSYPGEYVTDVKYVKMYQDSSYGLLPVASYNAVIKGGTNDWEQYMVNADVIDDPSVEYAFVKIFSNGDSKATIYFDKIEYSINGGEYKLIPNGSFENLMYDDLNSGPLLWTCWARDNSDYSKIQKSTVAYDGKYSMCFTECSNWSQTESINWIATAGGIKVKKGQKISIRFWAKTKNASSDKNGIMIDWCKTEKSYLDKSKLQSFVDDLIIKKRTKLNCPFFVGEFSPSLTGKRPDIFKYLSDLINYFNINKIHWTYYEYRQDFQYFGIYNCLPGYTTGKSPDRKEETELKNILINFFK